jgi:enterochelin esterase-like enzyme
MQSLRLACLALFFCLSQFVLVAQNAAPKSGTQPARKQGPPPIVSPELREDRTVTFRLRAPQAKEVSVSGEWGQAKPMTKDAQGVWSVTIGPLAPEIYGYRFTVDGFRTLDPGNANVKPSRSPTTSILEVPGEPALLHEFISVPHGTVHSHTYNSKSLGVLRNLRVYTPPGYEKGGKYPVLYLLHGSGDNDATWTVLGRAHLIIDNLLVQGKVRPMVIVMTDGHAVPPSSAESRGRNTDEFRRDLLTDVIPFIEANYHVKTDRMDRAIVGLSMGGGQSLTIGLNHPELFAWVGGMSSAVFNSESIARRAVSNPTEMNGQLKVLWFACGKSDSLLKANQDFSELLTKNGVKHEFVETEGNHSWPVWRKYLAEFAPLIFTEKK